VNNKHALIIGGTRGIGRALVRMFSEQGLLVSVIGRRPASDTDRQVPCTHYWAVDLADNSSFLGTLAEIVSKNGKLTQLIFFQRFRGDGDSWTGEMQTSLTATKIAINHLAEEFDGKPENSIAIVCSVASRFVADEQPVSYHVAKAGLVQMARYYAVVLGAKGIRVNCVSPGIVLKDESKHFYLENQQLLDFYKKIIPRGRMGTAEEIANVIAFLCSPEASIITGQEIIADAGLSLQWHESLARRFTKLKNLEITRQFREKSKNE